MAHMLHYVTVPLLIAHMSSRWYVLGTLLVLIMLHEAVKHQQTVSGSVDDCQRMGNSVTALSVPHGANHSKILVHTVPGSYYKVRVPAVSWWESHPFRWVLVGNAPCDTRGLAVCERPAVAWVPAVLTTRRLLTCLRTPRLESR